MFLKRNSQKQWPRSRGVEISRFG